MKLDLQRTVKSGKFIPEIDGLRFLAIASVVLFHLNNFIIAKDTNVYLHEIDTNNILFQPLNSGGIGVELFFILSGFVLGLPFARWHVLKEQSVNIRKYFLRRIIRLEPPYIIAMTILGFACVYVAKTMSLNEAIQSYFASIFYMHNFFYPGVLPYINVAAWSLEIEVQFYIIAPLLAYVFKISNQLTRRVVIIAAIIFCALLNTQFLSLPYLSILNALHNFLLGYLLVDFYISHDDTKSKPINKILIVCSTILFASIWLVKFPFQFRNLQFTSFTFIFLMTTGIFYYLVIVRKCFKLFKIKWIINIGGMCYSIYLIHYAIISAVGNPLMLYQFSDYQLVNQSIYALLLLTLVLIISTIFYKIVEQPFMRKKIN